MNKKAISFILAWAMIFSQLPLGAAAAEPAGQKLIGAVAEEQAGRLPLRAAAAETDTQPALKTTAEESNEQYGIVEYYSTYSEEGHTLTDGYCFSDDWFFEDSSVPNDALALVSMQLTAAAVDNEPDGLGAVFLDELGFEEIGSDYSDPSDPDFCNYTWGKKTITDGSETATLVAVQLQSYSFDKAIKRTGWKQNFRVNGEETGPEHAGFAKAMDGVPEKIASLGGSGKVKYWIVGQSRGGALADLLAAKLPAASGVSKEDIYAYTFEAPAVVESSAVPNNESEYGYIHNYYAHDDIVTMVPPWDMTRYGVSHDINTDQINEKLPEELKKLGSDMYELTQEESTAGPLVSSILEALTEKCPTREAYSASHTDSFTPDDGSEVTMNYTYQDVMTALMDVIFGEAFENVDADAILDHMSELYPAGYALLEAVRNGSDRKFYEAALGMDVFLKTCGIEHGLSDTELYALLKLLGPLMVDTDRESETEPATMDDLLVYFTPVFDLYAGSKHITFSHQFDTIIGRLKVLAGPQMDSLDLLIEEPSAGDPAAKAPSEAAKYIEALGYSWLAGAAEWEGEEDELPSDRVVYFDIALTAVAHSAGDDFAVTLNGKEPVAAPEITYKDGKSTVRATWAITLGSPEKVKVSFDAAGYAEDPEPVEVETGSLLKWALTPEDFGRVSDENGIWQFSDWIDGNGESWKALTAETNVTLYADWIRMLDKIEITFPIPHVGEVPDMPSVPDEAEYYIDEDNTYVIDSNYDDVTVVENTDPLSLDCRVQPGADKTAFLTEEDEWGLLEYKGTLTVNGEEVDANYDEDGGHLRFSYAFDPLPAEKKLPGKTTRGDLFNLAGNIKVTWKEVPGAKYYKVYREGLTDPSESVSDPVIVTSRLVGWDKEPGLTNGHKYRYRIVASLTGKGDPSGDSKLSYSKVTYRLRTVVIRSVKNTAPGKVTVKFDKTASGDSYVLRFSEREDMTGAKTRVVKGAGNTSCVIGGLKKGKTYYISIRVRKTVDGIHYYTTYGVPKKIKVTK